MILFSLFPETLLWNADVVYLRGNVRKPYLSQCPEPFPPSFLITWAIGPSRVFQLPNEPTYIRDPYRR